MICKLADLARSKSSILSDHLINIIFRRLIASSRSSTSGAENRLQTTSTLPCLQNPSGQRPFRCFRLKRFASAAFQGLLFPTFFSCIVKSYTWGNWPDDLPAVILQRSAPVLVLRLRLRVHPLNARWHALCGHSL
jgi:hypothetical protein